MQTRYLVCPSPRFTHAMGLNFELANAIGVQCVWLRHALPLSRAKATVVDPQNLKMIVVDVSSQARHPEAFLYGTIKALDASGIYFRIDDDELLTEDHLLYFGRYHCLEDFFLHKSIPRKWVNLAGYSSNLFGEDPQFRICNLKYSSEDKNIHTPGFKVKLIKKPLKLDAILHLSWLMESFADRRDKLALYNTIREGAGSDFEKWYLPENYSDDEHLWKVLSFSEYARFVEWKKRVGQLSGS